MSDTIFIVGSLIVIYIVKYLLEKQRSQSLFAMNLMKIQINSEKMLKILEDLQAKSNSREEILSHKQLREIHLLLMGMKKYVNAEDTQQLPKDLLSFYSKVLKIFQNED